MTDGTTLIERLSSSGPKRILSLDGGGIRGTLSIAFLERLETELRQRHDRPDLVLSDYFDLIGGTSTGAIIAGGLALGMETAEVKDHYFKLGPDAFNAKQSFLRRIIARYDAGPLEAHLREAFGEIRLGDAELRTGFCAVAKRADTWSLWPIHNHPDGVYGAENAELPMWRALRASSAAPTYFSPARIELAGGEVGAFVDGAISTTTNPALLMLIVATAKGYGFRWSAGSENLLLVSVGTGTWSESRSVDDVLGSRLWRWATEIPSMLMHDSNWHNQLLLQYLGKATIPWLIDSEVGDLEDELLGVDPLLTYTRYDMNLTAETAHELGFDEYAGLIKRLRQMDKADNALPLYEMGAAAAERVFDPQQLPPVFNLD